MSRHLKHIKFALKEGQTVVYDKLSGDYTIHFEDDDDMKFTEELFDDMITFHNVNAGEVVTDFINLRGKK